MILDKKENIQDDQTRKLLDNKQSNFNSPIIIKKMSHDDVIKEKSSSLSCPAHSTKEKETLLESFQEHLKLSLKTLNEGTGPLSRYRQTRFSSRRVRKRVVFKQGDCNVVQGNVAKRRRRYMQDIFTTLVDAQWRWTLLVFALNFLISWAAFAVVWWAIAYLHGDIEYLQMEEEMKEDGIDMEKLLNGTFTMCVTEIHSFTSAFLFSVETQHTIGYGNRYLTEECSEAIFVMCFQSITGVFIQAFMVGIVFAKLSRPKKRAQTLLFSRNAVICHRDGVPCLMFRVGDMRKSHIIEAHITKEGEELPFYQQELQVGADGGEDRLMFIWPTTIVHKIENESPLFSLSAQDMLKESFEIVVMLEGVVESTGMTTQARSSYLPSEILWGHRFEHVVNFRKESGEYEVDYMKFNNTYEIDTPLCSAKQLEEVRAEIVLPNGLDRLAALGVRTSQIQSSDETTESMEDIQSYSIPTSNYGNNNQNVGDLNTNNNNNLMLVASNVNNEKLNTFLSNGSLASTKPSTSYNQQRSKTPIKSNNRPIDSIC